MISKVYNARYRLEQLKGQEEQLLKDSKKLTKDIRLTQQEIRNHERAREIVRSVGQITQQEMEYHISDIASLALEGIFEDPYRLVVEFIKRRNKTECDLLFERNGERVDPTEATGGGAVDVAAFALRIVAWSMQTPQSRNVIILDEPLKFLDGRTDRLERASQMIKELSDRLGLQFIIITHEETLAEYADKTFEVTIHKGVSKVKEI